MARLVHIAALAIVVVVSVTACQAATPTATVPGQALVPPVVPLGSRSPVATPAPGSSAGPARASASPAAMTMAEAKKAYAAIAKAHNHVTDGIQKRYKGKPDVIRVNKRYWAEQAAKDAGFMKDVQRLTWPSDVAGDIRALLRAQAIMQRTEASAAKAKSEAALLNILVPFDRQVQKMVDAAAIVRSTLGLPPNA